MPSVVKDKVILNWENGDQFRGRALCLPGDQKEQPLSGKMTHANGDVYVGTFRDSRRHGYGKMKFANGDSYDGTWVDGSIVGEGRFRLCTDSVRFVGRFGTRRSAKDPGEKFSETMLYPGLTSANGLRPVAPNVASESGLNRNHVSWLTGQGAIEYSDGRVFKGEFASGEPIASTGNLEWAQDKKQQLCDRCNLLPHARLYLLLSICRHPNPIHHWAARAIYAPVERYVGELSPSGHPHGAGEAIYAEGSCYCGQWERGKPHGHGVFEAANGDVYEGLHVAGERCGFGSLRCAHGEVYTGMFAADHFDGRGLRVLPDGSAFDGSFKAGLEHGRGRQLLPGNVVFDGNWANGKRHGRGERGKDSDPWRWHSSQCPSPTHRSILMCFPCGRRHTLSRRHASGGILRNGQDDGSVAHVLPADPAWATRAVGPARHWPAAEHDDESI